jgi:hypothetical protein
MSGFPSEDLPHNIRDKRYHKLSPIIGIKPPKNQYVFVRNKKTPRKLSPKTLSKSSSKYYSPKTSSSLSRTTSSRTTGSYPTETRTASSRTTGSYPTETRTASSSLPRNTELYEQNNELQIQLDNCNTKNKIYKERLIKYRDLLERCQRSPSPKRIIQQGPFDTNLIPLKKAQQKIHHDTIFDLKRTPQYSPIPVKPLLSPIRKQKSPQKHFVSPIPTIPLLSPPGKYQKNRPLPVKIKQKSPQKPIPPPPPAIIPPPIGVNIKKKYEVIPKIPIVKQPSGIYNGRPLSAKIKQKSPRPQPPAVRPAPPAPPVAGPPRVAGAVNRDLLKDIVARKRPTDEQKLKVPVGRQSPKGARPQPPAVRPAPPVAGPPRIQHDFLKDIQKRYVKSPPKELKRRLTPPKNVEEKNVYQNLINKVANIKVKEMKEEKHIDEDDEWRISSRKKVTKKKQSPVKKPEPKPEPKAKEQFVYTSPPKELGRPAPKGLAEQLAKVRRAQRGSSS